MRSCGASARPRARGHGRRMRWPPSAPTLACSSRAALQGGKEEGEEGEPRPRGAGTTRARQRAPRRARAAAPRQAQRAAGRRTREEGVGAPAETFGGAARTSSHAARPPPSQSHGRHFASRRQGFANPAGWKGKGGGVRPPKRRAPMFFLAEIGDRMEAEGTVELVHHIGCLGTHWNHVAGEVVPAKLVDRVGAMRGAGSVWRPVRDAAMRGAAGRAASQPRRSVFHAGRPRASGPPSQTPNPGRASYASFVRRAASCCTSRGRRPCPSSSPWRCL